MKTPITWISSYYFVYNESHLPLKRMYIHAQVQKNEREIVNISL